VTRADVTDNDVFCQRVNGTKEFVEKPRQHLKCLNFTWIPGSTSPADVRGDFHEGVVPQFEDVEIATRQNFTREDNEFVEGEVEVYKWPGERFEIRKVRYEVSLENMKCNIVSFHWCNNAMKAWCSLSQTYTCYEVKQKNSCFHQKRWQNVWPGDCFFLLRCFGHFHWDIWITERFRSFVSQLY